MEDKKVIGFIAVIPLFGIALLLIAWEEDREFKAITPARHLELAENLISLDEAWKQLDAVPLNSPEAAKVPEMREKIKAKHLEKMHAAAVEADAKASSITGRAAAILELEKDLRNKGYDLNVSGSDTADEIIITSSDFADTDHRVQFLSAMRSKHSGPPCWAGLRAVRLKSSSVPFVGFNESYSLECPHNALCGERCQ